VIDPVTGVRAGELTEVKPAEGRLELKRGPKMDGAPLPPALVPGGPIGTRPQREALQRLADDIVAAGVESRERFAAARDRAFPRRRQGTTNSSFLPRPSCTSARSRRRISTSSVGREIVNVSFCAASARRPHGSSRISESRYLVAGLFVKSLTTNDPPGAGHWWFEGAEGSRPLLIQCGGKGSQRNLLTTAPFHPTRGRRVSPSA